MLAMSLAEAEIHSGLRKPSINFLTDVEKHINTPERAAAIGLKKKQWVESKKNASGASNSRYDVANEKDVNAGKHTSKDEEVTGVNEVLETRSLLWTPETRRWRPKLPA